MKNTLVRYQGGGYDGCIWEWNYAYFDEQGKFHDMYSSGSMGRPEESQVRAIIAELEGEDAPELFNLSLQPDIDRLNEINAESVMSISQWLEKEIGYELEVQCDDCKTYVDVLDIQLTDLRKEGGIVYSHHGKVCTLCFSEKQCDGCNEYNPGELKTIEDEGQYCADGCYDEKMRELAECCTPS